MRALAAVLGVICFTPIAVYAQINCQKWADGNETCYYADGRIMEGRRQVDGSTRWTENRAQAATPGSVTGGASNSDASDTSRDSANSMHSGTGNPMPGDRIMQRRGAAGNAPPGMPGAAIGNCRRGARASIECDTSNLR